ncbi:MAG: hypothetical protein U0V74_04435 [Chitinophagales bacterium]
MPKVTYLLGAGASAEALPVVSQFNEHLNEFKTFITDWINAEQTLRNEHENIPNSLTKQFIDTLNEIIAQERKHYSIDTYAKKLMLSGKEKEYKKLKSILICYFLFEQTSKNGYYPKNPDISNPKSDAYQLRKKLESKILQTLDKRYDAFFATLLTRKNNTLELPKDINIISWNYDNQFELSYSEFANQSLAKSVKNLGILSNPTIPDQSCNPQIIKMNGTAYSELINSENYRQLRGNKLINLSLNFEPSTIQDWIDIFNSLHMAENISFFSFAWETNFETDQRIKIATEKLNKTDSLVVIGYSFPYYNMEVDKLLLSSLKEKTKIYIQDQPERLETLVDRLTYFGIEKSQIHTVKQTDLFFIPPEYIGQQQKFS